MKRTSLYVVGSFICLSLVNAQPAWATRLPIHDAAESSEYKIKVGGMLGRGLLNITTSFVDIITQTINETKVGPPFVGTVRGVATGAACGVLRLGSGVIDIVTFWVPGTNGFPVSASYDQCIGGKSPIAMTTISPDYIESPILAEPIVEAEAEIESIAQVVEPVEAEPIETSNVTSEDKWTK